MSSGTEFNSVSAQSPVLSGEFHAEKVGTGEPVRQESLMDASKTLVLELCRHGKIRRLEKGQIPFVVVELKRPGLVVWALFELPLEQLPSLVGVPTACGLREQLSTMRGLGVFIGVRNDNGPNEGGLVEIADAPELPC